MTLPHLFNTLTGKIEPVAPSDGKTLRMYVCGPTIYDYGHIGNFRTFLHVDLLRRTLKSHGIAVHHVMNITDVDDKIIRNAIARGLEIGEYTAPYEAAFFEDLEWLHVERPEDVAHATENIPEMVALVERLEKAGAAYRTEDGSWYFRIASFADYGKLSKKDFSGIEDGARIDVDEYDKDSARDFALWKAPTAGEHHWQTEIGPGRPGWHLECSAMAMKYLGETIDLHAGGEDLMFPHHENEIAQCESATGKQFARHWMHVRFLLVDGRKMSKSEGNFYTLRDLLLKGYKASSIRLALISVPYRHPLNFTLEGLADAAASIDRLRTFAARLRQGGFAEGEDAELAETTRTTAARMMAAMDDDLNTAEARAAIFDLVRAGNIAADQGRLLTGNQSAIEEALRRFDSIFAVLVDDDEQITRAALDWAHKAGRMDDVSDELKATLELSDADIDALIEERNRARRGRNFARADEIRNELAARGIILEDSKSGVQWKRK